MFFNMIFIRQAEKYHIDEVYKIKRDMLWYFENKEMSIHEYS